MICYVLTNDIGESPAYVEMGPTNNPGFSKILKKRFLIMGMGQPSITNFFNKKRNNNEEKSKSANDKETNEKSDIPPPIDLTESDVSIKEVIRIQV